MSIVLPDVVALTIAHVRASLATRAEPFASDVWVSNATPADPDGSTRRDPRMVIVRGDGGSRIGDVRGLARLGLNVWAETDADATDLANLVSAIVSGMAGIGPVRRATATLPADVTGEDGHARRYLTAELVIRGHSL